LTRKSSALRIGTRGSALALVQARLVADMLDVDVDLVEIRTSGDAGERKMDKTRWVKEIEEALLAEEIDLAVHSAKDVPGELPSGLAIVGVPAREDPRDALVGAASLDDLPEGATVGTSSLRRRAQLLAERPDLDVQELRGNVDTRLRRLEEGGFDAIVLALAGLRRLGRDQDAAPLDPIAITPAPGQGCLALEGRRGDDRAAELAVSITDTDALVCLTAERAAVERLDATCNTPVGAYAELGDDGLLLAAFAGTPDGSSWIRDAALADPSEPAGLGAALGERLVAAGAAEILAVAEDQAGAASRRF
jgi:hydroxymethylbilane synthase